MTENEVVKILLGKTRNQTMIDVLASAGLKSAIYGPGSLFACGCCVDSEFVAETLDPLFRQAYQAGLTQRKIVRKKNHD